MVTSGRSLACTGFEQCPSRQIRLVIGSGSATQMLAQQMLACAAGHDTRVSKER
jgi:hypothetical protein